MQAMETGKEKRPGRPGRNGKAAGNGVAPPRLKLNGEQEAAVKTTASVLVLSGAGTGKTRVITERIRHLIAERAAKPGRILALTFTNKAAREMRQRLVGLDSRDMFVGTFHSFGLRILRRFHAAAGLPPDFGVIDGGDQFSIVKQLLAERRVPGVVDKPSPADIRHVIRDVQNRKDDRLDLSAIIGKGPRIYDTHIRDPARPRRLPRGLRVPPHRRAQGRLPGPDHPRLRADPDRRHGPQGARRRLRPHPHRRAAGHQRRPAADDRPAAGAQDPV